MTRLEELALAAVDDALSDAEWDELAAAAAADPEGFNVAVQLWRVEATLRAGRTEFDLSGAILGAIRERQGARVTAGVMERLRRLGPPGGAARAAEPACAPQKQTRPRRRGRAVLALAACATAALFTGLYFVRPGAPTDLVADQASEAEVKRGWIWAPLRAGDALRNGDSVRTGPGGTASLRYANEPTSLVLENQTEIRLDETSEGKRWRLARGEVRVQAAHQPARHPLVMTTRQSRAEVVGTAFSLSARPSATWLRVDDGAVRLAVPTAGATALVPAGAFAVAARDLPLAVHPAGAEPWLAEALPLDWSRAFHDGDGVWTLQGRSLRQSKVSRVPMTHAVWGTPNSPGSAFVLPVVTGDSVQLECTVTPERFIQDEVPGWIWPYNFGMRFYLGTHIFQLNLRAGGAAGRPELEFAGGSPAAGAPPTPLRGRAKASVADVGHGARSFRLQLWRRPEGECRVLAKVWQAGAEPRNWLIDTSFTLDRPLVQVGVQTVSAACRFDDFSVSLIE